MNNAVADIHWKSQIDGGRSAPPSGPKYVAPARFNVPDDQWPSEAWSLVVELIEVLESPSKWLAEVRFLVPEAPQHWIAAGSSFELYEGGKCVAHGKIIEGPGEIGDGKKT